MLISDDYLFIHLQRTGGSFVEQFIIEHLDGWEFVEPKHGGISDTSGLLKQAKGRYVFGCVRNPWEWYVSWWHANKIAESTVFPEIFTDDCKSDFNYFIDFIMGPDSRIVEFGCGVLTFRYLRSYYYNVGDRLYEIVDYVMRTESLINDMKRVLKLDANLSRLLDEYPIVNAGSHAPYWEYYNDRSIEIVADKDDFIISKYGYQFRG